MSKLSVSTLVIDCKGTDLAAATAFWSAALGRGVKEREPGAEKYAELETPPGEPRLLLQQVAHDSRIHLDVDVDRADVEAEVARLVGLGAREVERIKDWVVLEAPTGHRFCVVPR
jgi:hypothetical protein